MQGLSKLENRELHDVISVSGLVAFREDPEIYKLRYIEKKNEPTDSMEFGSLVHMAVLEPEKFSLEYTSAPPKTDENDFSGDQLKALCKELGLKSTGTKRELAALIRTVKPEFKVYEEIIDEMQGSGKKLLPPDQYQAILTIKEKILSHPKVGNWLKIAQKEILGHWTHKSGAVLTFKADAFLQVKDVGVCIDLKITKDFDEYNFMRSAFKSGFHIQAAAYLNALTAVSGFNVDQFMWIAIEPKAPYRVRFYQADSGMISAGDSELDYYLKEFLNAKKANNFGPREEDLQIQPMSLSSWAFESVKEVYEH